MSEKKLYLCRMQVKRNINRFPSTFRFQLTTLERDGVIANCENLKDLKFNPSLPYCFTEQEFRKTLVCIHADSRFHRFGTDSKDNAIKS